LKADPDQRSLDLAAHDDRVPGIDGADAVQIDRHVAGYDRRGDDGHGWRKRSSQCRRPIGAGGGKTESYTQHQRCASGCHDRCNPPSHLDLPLIAPVCSRWQLAAVPAPEIGRRLRKTK
jgi:hypothetical protein